MKGTPRSIAIAVLALALLVPASGAAQVDPCHPVPIPDLCKPEPQPSPTPTPKPSPDPAPSPKPSPAPPEEPGGGGKAKKDGGEGRDRSKRDGKSGPQRGARQRDRITLEDQPFALGGPKNTARLMKILTRLAQFGVPVQRSLFSVVGPFPVAGLAWWSDDWHACRDGCTRLHKGLDIFAKPGTPLVSAADGVVTQKGVGALSGLHVEVEDANGIQYFYAHLSGWADGLEIGQQVEMGQVIGFVGNTGNAILTPPHVHFEFQPNGIPQPPKPWVDTWLEIAERRALALLNERSGERPISLEDLDTFRLTRLLELAAEEGPGAPSARLLLIAGLQPAASSLQMVRQTVDSMAWEIDWTDRVDRDLAALFAEYRRLVADQGFLSPFLASGIGETPGEPERLDVAELGD